MNVAKTAILLGMKRTRIVADLKIKGLLLKTEEHFYKVGHGDRSGSIIEFYLAD